MPRTGRAAKPAPAEPPQTASPTPVRVGLISLGCAKNLVDAEIMLGALIRDGVEITNDAAQADVVIINTCSFIDSAQEESVDTILQTAELREAQHRGQGLIVSGCLPQRFRDDLPKLLPEVDAFMGIDQVAQVGQIVRQAIAHRAERLRIAETAPARKQRKTATDRAIPNLAKAKPQGGDEAGASLRGTDAFGRTKTVVTPAPAAPPPLSMSACARRIFRTMPRRGFGLRHATSPTSRSPKAAITLAASASFPGCAAAIAAVSNRTWCRKPANSWPRASRNSTSFRKIPPTTGSICARPQPRHRLSGAVHRGR